MIERERMGGLNVSEDNAEYRYVRPLPCILDEHGETRKQTVKQLFAKVDEELNELKEIVYRFQSADMLCVELSKNHDTWRDIAEEAADTITAITTLCAAFGIDAEMRNKAQERVNQKNFERARL